MKHSKLNFSAYLIIISFVILFYQCENRGSDESFIFPEIENIDQSVYNEIQKTCDSYWDLSNMIDTTFKIIKDHDEYAVHCDGFIDGVLYEFVIRVDEYGKWINDGRSIKEQSP